MDSDSNSSEKMNRFLIHGIASHEIICDQDNPENQENDNPIHFTVKREEEVMIDDVPFVESESEETIIGFDHNLKSTGPPPTPDSSPPRAHDDRDDNLNTISAFEFESEINLVPIEPPSDMLPPEMSEYAEDEEQFELIVDSQKTDSFELSLDTSLVDHQYSQPEAGNREFCDDLVQNLLEDTGNIQNSSAVELLSKFTDMFEHFVGDEAETQMALYLRSMKETLSERTVKCQKSPRISIQDQLPDRPQKLPDNTSLAVQRFNGVFTNQSNPNGKQDSLEQDSPDSEQRLPSNNLDLSEDATKIFLPETPPSIDDDDVLIVENTKLAEEIAEIKAEKMSQLPIPEIEIVRTKIKSVQDIGIKLSKEAEDLLGAPICTIDGAVDARKKLLTVLKGFREEFTQLMRDVKGQDVDAETVKKDVNEIEKKALINALSDSSDYMSSTDSEDMDQVINLNRKIPAPATPAVVSSTKEDSDLSETEAAKVVTLDPISSPEIQEIHERKRDMNQEIEKLLDFSNLNFPKPASSRKTKPKKLFKKKKLKRDSDIESISGSSSDENALSTSSSVSIQTFVSLSAEI